MARESPRSLPPCSPKNAQQISNTLPDEWFSACPLGCAWNPSPGMMSTFGTCHNTGAIPAGVHTAVAGLLPCLALPCSRRANLSSFKAQGFHNKIHTPSRTDRAARDGNPHTRVTHPTCPSLQCWPKGNVKFTSDLGHTNAAHTWALIHTSHQQNLHLILRHDISPTLISLNTY